MSGHTKGTAGLAGIVKNSLYIQHGIIPPNLLFDQLSPQLEPFSASLKLPVKAMSWPGSEARGPTPRVCRTHLALGELMRMRFLRAMRKA